MSRQIISSPHKHDDSSVQAIMREVVLLLVPAVLLYAVVISWGIIIQCILAITFALLIEALMLRIRKQPAEIFLTDYSVIITALLFALSISPISPWWISLFGMLFAVALVKHAFGGLGNNLFNPAMAGFVFVLLSFPAESTIWPAAKSIIPEAVGISDSLKFIFSSSSGSPALDAISSATPLAYTQSSVSGMFMLSEFSEHDVYGLLSGTSWEWLALYCLLAGSYLCFRKIINWQVPATLIGALFLFSLFFYWFDPEVYSSPLFHVFSFSTMLGAFFIATDPVTSATTFRGKLIFAASIGILTYTIRTWGAYPDGMAFAILLMNCAVPLLDYHLRPRVLGESSANQ